MSSTHATASNAKNERRASGTNRKRRGDSAKESRAARSTLRCDNANNRSRSAAGRQEFVRPSTEAPRRHTRQPPQPTTGDPAAAWTEKGGADLQPRTPSAARTTVRGPNAPRFPLARASLTRRPDAKPEPTTTPASPPLRGRAERFLKPASSHRQTRAEKRDVALDGTSVSSTTSPPTPSPANVPHARQQHQTSAPRHDRPPS